MSRMANRSYLGIWTRGFSAETMLAQFRSLLETVPFSAKRHGFSGLVVRALDPSETPLDDHDLRGLPLDAAGIIEMAREQLNADTEYEAGAHWDLWVYDAGAGAWRFEPQPLEIICNGPDYDGGVCAEAGHFQADIGFEHLFTGHAGLLSSNGNRVAAPQHPAEAEFLARMQRPERLREYYEKTRENIAKLMGWVRAIEQALPVERYGLWSEGEENFEARLDEILAVR